MSKIYEALEHARRELEKGAESDESELILKLDSEEIQPEASKTIDADERELIRETRNENAAPNASIGVQQDDRVVIHDFGPEQDYPEEAADTESEESEVIREPGPVSSRDFEAEEEILTLYHSINAILPMNTRRIIQFIGPQGEEDVSSVARSFSYVAMKSGKTVLLLEGDEKQHKQKHYFDIRNDHSWMDIAGKSATVQQVINQIANTSFYVSTSREQSSGNEPISLPGAFESFVRGVGDTYDLIVVDSSPAQITSDGMLLSHLMDGIVLVVESDRTLGNIAEDIKNKIQRRGGNVLGVVFTRERHYLPDLLARHMMPGT
jgi:Mrp family chromosome partitioning ATPase